MEFQTIGVIGAGVMGRGLAQDLAQHKKNVILIDISDDVLEKAKAEIQNAIRFSAFFAKDNSKLEDAATVMA